MARRQPSASGTRRPARMGDSTATRSCQDGGMLTAISSQLADLVEAMAPSVVQVRAGGRAASGLVYGPGLVLTTGRTIGRDEHPEVRAWDNRAFPAEVAGWDPGSRLVLLRVPEL